MFVLGHAPPFTLFQCGDYAEATAETDELVSLADEKGSLFWKAIPVTRL
jgi:hypothetical protein